MSRIIPARAGFTPPRTLCGCGSLDHPRSRGVYGGSINTPGTLLGSSPLARGLPTVPPGTSTARRIIPARAGFTSSDLLRIAGTTDHPRSRGVYFGRLRRLRQVRGSSPLARGLRIIRQRNTSVRGIIPARAGFTRPDAMDGLGSKDHPRSRGVYVVKKSMKHIKPGSSPLARGLLR